MKRLISSITMLLCFLMVTGFNIENAIIPKSEIVSVVDADGKPIPHLFAYWFAWQAFHPDTTVYKKP